MSDLGSDEESSMLPTDVLLMAGTNMNPVGIPFYRGLLTQCKDADERLSLVDSQSFSAGYSDEGVRP